MISLDSFSLKGKVALVTGGTYGIGFAIASALAKAGAKIAFNDRNQEKLDEGIANYKKLGIDAKGYICDVTHEDEVINMVEDIKNELGTVFISDEPAFLGAGVLALLIDHISRLVPDNELNAAGLDIFQKSFVFPACLVKLCNMLEFCIVLSQFRLEKILNIEAGDIQRRHDKKNVQKQKNAQCAPGTDVSYFPVELDSFLIAFIPDPCHINALPSLIKQVRLRRLCP